MTERIHRWTKGHLRDQLGVIRGENSPSIVLKNATYLNSVLGQWLKANIWIYDNRIVYVGESLPESMKNTEVIDCQNYFLVPGYIEPHAHPFQLYNPHSFAEYAAARGTTTLINDNLMFFLHLDEKKAFSIMEDLDNLPSSIYWWCRYDAQTELGEEEELFTNSRMKAWLDHHLVVQGGELTSWPKVLNGDDTILHWMQETRRLRKPIEGHFPGASEKTLTKMALLGVTADHESMTGEEVMLRLSLGYTTSIRYSSIRPDLPTIIEEILELGLTNFDRVLFTTDGSPPSFYKDGVIDNIIRIAIEKGMDPLIAYNIASYNVARHYHLDHKLGLIAPGRFAHINFLKDKHNPIPTSVLAKGKWARFEDKDCFPVRDFPWGKYEIKPLSIEWSLTEDDMHFSMPLGIEMVNAVILKPYRIAVDVTQSSIAMEHDESFFIMVDQNGKWIINTVLKGFATGVSGFASSYSHTGDIILIGKDKQDMIAAFERLKDIGGGIVLVENGEVVAEVGLDLFGGMSSKPMQQLIDEEEKLVKCIRDRGYKHADPIYSLLFFSATHLPYIRVTQQGIYDVKKKTVLFPSIMR